MVSSSAVLVVANSTLILEVTVPESSDQATAGDTSGSLSKVSESG